MTRSISPWLEDTGDLTPRPALPGDRDVDVAILGAGYTGLWTAWSLLQRQPGIRVALVEAQIAGYGGSGRNGSWCVAGMGLTLAETLRRHGEATAVAVTRTMRETVDEVGRVCAEHLPLADFHKGGVLRVARGPHEWPAVEAGFALRRRLGLDEGAAVLSAADLQQRLAVDRATGALFEEHCATVHPGHLVRGLARMVEQRGATVWEQTRVNHVQPGGGGRRPWLQTDRGRVTADVVVLAGEAFLSQLRPLRRHVLPVYSLVVMTQPLTPAQLEAVGWSGRECVSSHRLTVDYLARTVDGRILLGGRGAPYHYGSRIDPAYDRHERTHESLRRSLAQWFPELGEVEFTHAWGGPVGMPRDWVPTISHQPRTGLAAAFGYTGQGVAAANLAGRVLADSIAGDAKRWEWLPAFGHRPRRWEPEPVRWLAVRALQTALTRLDRRTAATGRPPTGRTIAERLTRH